MHVCLSCFCLSRTSCNYLKKVIKYSLSVSVSVSVCVSLSLSLSLSLSSSIAKMAIVNQTFFGVFTVYMFVFK